MKVEKLVYPVILGILFLSTIALWAPDRPFFFQPDKKDIYEITVYYKKGDGPSGVVWGRVRDYCALKKTEDKSLNLTCRGVVVEDKVKAGLVECSKNGKVVNSRKVNSASIAHMKKAKMIFSSMLGLTDRAAKQMEQVQRKPDVSQKNNQAELAKKNSQRRG